MISGDDLYKVMCAMVPLYFAMLVAYGAVKWWNIFTPEQCSGINRFVAVFAVPVLSFHFISENNPYQMDAKFIFADTVSKLAVLALLTAWGTFLGGGLDWSITLFSVATLPNTLVMGIPLLHAMYGHFTQSLMVQLVVLQCIIWYTLLLFLYEYRAATELIRSQFPGTAAASISKFEIDGDVMSLDGRDTLLADSEMDGNGRIRVRIRRSTSSAPDQGLSSAVGLTPRPSNLSGAEIFSVTTPAPEFGTGDFPPIGYRTAMSPPFSGDGYASSEAHSQQPTPRASNFTEMEATAAAAPVALMGTVSPVGGKVYRQQSPAFPGRRLLWDRLSPVRKGRQGGEEKQGLKNDVVAEKELSFRQGSPMPNDQEVGTKHTSTNQAMPRAIVMLRLILIVVGRKLSRNPNTYSSILGLIWSLVSFRWDVAMPSLLKSSIKIISDAGLGMAMFSLGLFMALQPRLIACGTKRAVVVMAIRFLGGPALMSAASVAVGLRGIHLHTAIVQAALPQGIVPFVFAREYGLHPDILSTGVIFGMLISLPITLLYYVLLGL